MLIKRMINPIDKGIWRSMDNYVQSINEISNIIDTWAYDATETYSWSYTVNDSNICYTLLVPGFKKTDLDVEINGRHLVVKTSDESTSSFGKFRTEITLHKEADLAKYEAKVEDGVFYISFERLQNLAPAKQKITLI
jgi:HSP20 family molecular chaperone IbpA